MTLYTMGYGRWPAKQRLARMVRALKNAGVNTLADIRHSPYSASLDPKSNYGLRDWHLQTRDSGITRHLEHEGIAYIWLGELGNPQKNDPRMAVLRAHLDSADDTWPVNRGLKLLLKLVQDNDEHCCLPCVCKDYDRCHRKIIADILRDRFFADELGMCDLS